jgi:hypothetical protein
LAEQPFRFPSGRHAGAELKMINDLPVLTVQGTPEEIGSAVGMLALKPGSRVLGYPRGLLELHKAQLLWNVFVRAGKRMYNSFPDDRKNELEAIAKSAGADRDLVIAGNTFFDLGKMFTCSALLVEKSKSATGGPLLGRNLDYPSLDYIHQYSLVTVYRPKGKLAFVSVGFPGLVGVLSGMNEAGLALGVLEVFGTKGDGPHFDVKGMPYALSLRQVLENARTIDEARKLLDGMSRTATINVAIADRNETAVLEITPRCVVKRSAQNDVCVATNHFISKALKPEIPVNMNESFERYAILANVGKQMDKVDIATLLKKLDATNLGTLTLQTMIFEPATLRLHLAVGTTPASKGPLRKLELADLLRREKKPPQRQPIERSRKTGIGPRFAPHLPHSPQPAQNRL